MPSSRKQRRIALFVGLLNVLLLAFVLPTAKTMLRDIPAFLPGFITAVLIFDLLTSFLLFSQFRVNRSPAQAVLAATYLFSGLITIPHILTFPGTFTPSGLLHAGPQTSVWLWVFWHAGFPIGILIYALLERYSVRRTLSARQAKGLLLFLLASVLFWVTALTLLTTLGHDLLPVILQKWNYKQLWDSGVGPVVMILNIVAFLTAWIVTRGSTVLQLWVCISIFALMIDVILTLHAGARFSFGWYMARANSFLSSSIVLATLLIEITSLYLKTAEHEQRIKHQAHYDALTGLPNRYLFTERLQQALDRAAVQQRKVSVLFIDLDGFKGVNDTHGHDMGDLLLVEVGQRLNSCIRAQDLVARMGGDEFTVILPSIEERAGAERVAARMLEVLHEPFQIRGQTLSISASIGVSISPDDGTDSISLMKRADQAMYKAKEAGKNTFV